MKLSSLSQKQAEQIVGQPLGELVSPLRFQVCGATLMAGPNDRGEIAFILSGTEEQLLEVNRRLKADERGFATS